MANVVFFPNVALKSTPAGSEIRMATGNVSEWWLLRDSLIVDLEREKEIRLIEQRGRVSLPVSKF
jgi:hypothetical protein